MARASCSASSSASCAGTASSIAGLRDGQTAAAKGGRLPRPAPPMLEVAPPPPLVEPHAEALPVAIGTVVGAAGIELQTDAPAMPPLVEMAKVLRRELGLASDMPIPGVVDAACRDLGVSAEGNLVERAARCWRAVRGTQTV